MMAALSTSLAPRQQTLSIRLAAFVMLQLHTAELRKVEKVEFGLEHRGHGGGYAACEHLPQLRPKKN